MLLKFSPLSTELVLEFGSCSGVILEIELETETASLIPGVSNVC